MTGLNGLSEIVKLVSVLLLANYWKIILFADVFGLKELKHHSHCKTV